MHEAPPLSAVSTNINGNVMNDMGDDSPLPLPELRKRLSSRTYAWLEAAVTTGGPERRVRSGAGGGGQEDEDEDDEEEEYGRRFAAGLFGSPDGGDDGRDGDDDGGGGGRGGGATRRVQSWSSSAANPDGFGGIFRGGCDDDDDHGGGDDDHHHQDDGEGSTRGPEEEEENGGDGDCGAVRVRYVLSDASGGHGDEVWAASRHVANLLADPARCRDLLSPLLSRRRGGAAPSSDGDGDDVRRPRPHPLLGLRFLELGAGGGIPSWTAMRRGARVVCTDRPIPDRIRCLAEGAERNGRAMTMMAASASSSLPPDDHRAALLRYADEAGVCPYEWGGPVEDVLVGGAAVAAEGGDERQRRRQRRFDVAVAADCVYMPESHPALLNSLRMLLSDDGVGLLPFALHGNVDDGKVWGIVDQARGMGFAVEVMESEQLTPQSSGMDAKRGLVHMLRLTKVS